MCKKQLSSLVVPLIIIFLLFFKSSSAASAHFLRMNEGIGVTLHVEPDDDPAAGEKTALTFDFKDSEGNFQIKDCSCLVNIFQDQQLIDTQLVEVVGEEGDVHIGRAWTTFPERGVYTIQIVGKPVIVDQFHSFMSSYDMRVQRIAPPSNQQTTQAMVSFTNSEAIYFIGGVLFIIFLASFIYFQVIQPRPISGKGL